MYFAYFIAAMYGVFSPIVPLGGGGSPSELEVMKAPMR